MKGVDSLALIDKNVEFERFIETHEKYGDTPCTRHWMSILTMN